MRPRRHHLHGICRHGKRRPVACKSFVWIYRLLHDRSGRYYIYCQKGQFRGQPFGAEFPVMENPINNKENEIELGTALAEFYRNRWQIETGYRVKEYTFRGKTCSKNYVIRYFYFMLSIILYDCWVLADLMIILALGIRTVKTTVTAKTFSAKLLTITIPYG